MNMNITHTLFPSSVSTAAHYRHRLSVVFSVDNLNTSMQTLLHHDCWRVSMWWQQHWFYLVLIWVVPSGGGGKDFVLHHMFFFVFFFLSFNTFRPADYGIYEQYVLAAHIWMMVSSLFRELEVTWWSNESDTSCSLLCSAIVTKPICIKSFVHFSIDPEAVILKYISLGITQLMQTFQKRKMSQLCGFFFFSFLCRYVFSVFKFTCHSLLWRKWNKIIANWIHSFRSATVVFIINDDNDICDE